MADAPRGYRKETREVFVKKNSDFSESHKHGGLKSGLARDRKTNNLSHVVIGDRVESHQHSDGEPVEFVADDTPDISRLVPLALVAIAAGAAGMRVAQNAKEKRQAANAELSSAGPARATPAGWYAIAGTANRLRYWNGSTWTDDYAQRAAAAPKVNADWYPDPADAAQLRYWDGATWTHHISPRPRAVSASADWYPDPSNAAQLRYWDGSTWTHHVTNDPGAAVGLRKTNAASTGSELSPANAEPRVNMTRAEWQAYVEGWLRAGAIQQELWRRLSSAHIQDPDDATLAAQRRMEAINPEEGARLIQAMLEANPALREQVSFLDLTRLFGPDPGAPLGIMANHDQERPRQV